MNFDDYTTRIEQEMTDEIGANLSDPRLADFIDWEGYARHCADRDELHIGTDPTTGDEYVA